MSGVIDERGQQWERCNSCARWTKYEELRYQRPNAEFEYGRDLCAHCHQTVIRGAPTKHYVAVH